jgi:predicted transcriptional regulator
MPDAEPTQPAAARSAGAEWVVLDLLLDADEQRPWSVAELVREVGRPVNVADAIDALHGAGLVHRTSDDFVFVTRAAVRFDQLRR